MKKKSTIILMIVASCIVLGGTSFGIVIATTWGEYEYADSYYYRPSIPSSIEKLNVISDIGQVNIKYNTTPTNYYAELDLDIKIVGGFVNGKNFSDFFHPIEWTNTSAIISFKLDAKANPVFILGLSHQITIDLTLRTDVIYDINAYCGTGGINMNIPENIVINNTSLSTSTGSVMLNSAENTTFQGSLDVSTSTGKVSVYAKHTNFSQGLNTGSSTGSLILNFSQCILGDNLIGTVSTGSVSLKSYNMNYMKDSVWYIHTSTGRVDIQIRQYIEMNASITGTIGSSTGSIDILYDDSLSTIGAEFTCSVSTGSISYNPLGLGGLNKIGGVVSTADYNSATNKYTFSVSTSTGSIEILGQSL
ncbi:MAG: hypothetical protein ACFFDY_09230 [Candidatus Thorarchaeota archaeon]